MPVVDGVELEEFEEEVDEELFRVKVIFFAELV